MNSTITDVSTLLMIDSACARDRDDAFSVVPLADGHGWVVEVHIAGVADVVALGSVADEQAYLRAETRYLPGRTIPMLGETAEQAATLTSEAARTSLRVAGTVTTDGQLVDVTVGRGQIPSGRCVAVDHAEVPGILTDPEHPLHAWLAAADAAAQVLLGARRDGGALAFYDLTRGWAANEDGSIVAIPDALRTVAYVIVQELMIATNEAVALWCVEQGLPILFRNHRPNPVAGSTDELMTEIAAAGGDPDLFAKLRGRLLSTLRVATYDPTVHGHYGLRLSAYTHVTSPLRRVADLINQRIILAHLDHTPAPYTGEQLAALGGDLNRRTRAAREAKKNHFKHADQRIVAREAARDLTVLDARTFHKVLKSAAPQNPQPPATPANTDPGPAIPSPPHDTTTLTVLNLDGAKKPKALSNPIAWLMSLAQNNNQPPPEWEIRTDGPAHAPRFTATVHLAGHTATADATTKTAAKTASATALVEALFARH